jgi:hypothetical protein
MRSFPHFYVTKLGQVTSLDHMEMGKKPHFHVTAVEVHATSPTHSHYADPRQPTQ